MLEHPAPLATNVPLGAATPMTCFHSSQCSVCGGSAQKPYKERAPICAKCSRRRWRLKNADRIRAYFRERRRAKRDEINAHARSWRAANKDRTRISRLLDAAKLRAKIAGVPFSLETIALTESCPICARVFTPITGKQGGSVPSSPSIDRIIPALGYTAENTWLICRGCNATKSNATPEFMRRILAEVESRNLERKAS